MSDLAAQRTRTKAGIAIGFGGGAALYAVGYVAWPSVSLLTVADRLAYAAWLAAGPAVFLYAVFFSCLRLRDTPEAVNPLTNSESPRWKINQRVLTNTVEQMAIFLPLLFALAARVDAAHAFLLPLHVACWLVARVAFWVGYRIDPAWRAPGMTWTHATSLVTLLWVLRFTFTA